MITGLFVCAWLILWLAPETGLGRVLHRWMLERPTAWMARITRGQVVLCILVMLVAVGAMWLLKAEAGPLLGLATPDIGFVIASFEVTTWLDAITGALLLATSVRWRALRLAVWRGNGSQSRHRRSRRPRPVTRADNDDERSSWLAAA